MNAIDRALCLSLLAFLGACGSGSEAAPAPEKERSAPLEERSIPDPSLLVQAEEALLGGDFEAVERLLEPVVSAEFPTGRAELLFALAHHKRKRYPAAEPWFEAAAAAPGEWNGVESVPYYLGWCCYYLGDLEGARTSFVEHRELNPEEGDTVFALGVIDLDLGEPERAAERFEEAIGLHRAALAQGKQHLVPDLAKSWARLGDARSAVGDLPGARTALERCVQLYPPFHVAWFRLGSVLRELGEEQAAQAAFAEHERWSAADSQ